MKKPKLTSFSKLSKQLKTLRASMGLMYALSGYISNALKVLGHIQLSIGAAMWGAKGAQPYGAINGKALANTSRVSCILRGKGFSGRKWPGTNPHSSCATPTTIPSPSM